MRGIKKQGIHRFIRSQQGFSLISGLMVTAGAMVAINGVVGAVVTSMKAQKATSVRHDRENVKLTVERSLFNNCTGMLKGQPYMSSTLKINDSSGSGAALYEIGQKLPGGLDVVEDIQIASVTATDTTDEYRAVLDVELSISDKDMKSVIGVTNKKTLEFPIVMTAPGGMIVSCFPDGVRDDPKKVVRTMCTSTGSNTNHVFIESSTGANFACKTGDEVVNFQGYFSKACDIDKNGCIDGADLAAIDTNGDGELTKQEFLTALDTDGNNWIGPGDDVAMVNCATYALTLNDSLLVAECGTGGGGSTDGCGRDIECAEDDGGEGGP